MEKEEKDIRFVARFYRENRLDTTQAWQKLGIGCLLYTSPSPRD